MKRRVLALCGAALSAVLLLAAVAYAADAAGVAAGGDMTQAYLTLGILLAAGALFLTEIVPLPVTAMLVPVALAVTGIVKPGPAFSNFGDSTVILFMGMFIVGESIFKTGFADKIGDWTMRMSGGNEVKLLLLVVVVIGLMSSVLSNTGTVAVTMPMVIAMCRSSKIAPSRLLIPAAFASSLGGTITLIGTPPNGIVNAMLVSATETAPAELGIRSFGFFEFAKIGIPLLIMGLLYYSFIGRHFLIDTSHRSEAGKSIADAEAEAATASAASKRRPEKIWFSIGIFIFVLVIMVTEVMSLHVAAMFGVCLIVSTGTLTMKEAFDAVDWQTIWLFAGMLSMSTAMRDSGAASLLAETIVHQVHNPLAIMAVICAITAILTNFMSNTATAALMCPLAIPLAIQTGINPMPLAMGIGVSASCCFLTPIATPPNTIIFGPGKYTFVDYMKIGWPLQLISFVMCIVIIPIFWPL
ncbi:MAG: SLC13 family permease [Synergistaceae bacterium]|jgi:anion transporter|nr:SLC13 family permease [Synergistaceae bacterium]